MFQAKLLTYTNKQKYWDYIMKFNVSMYLINNKMLLKLCRILRKIWQSDIYWNTLLNLTDSWCILDISL